MRIALVPLAGGRATTYEIRPAGPRESLDDIELTFGGTDPEVAGSNPDLATAKTRNGAFFVTGVNEIFLRA
jgi:hypothetical protein